MKRKKIKPTNEADVLVRSRRRCCICFGLSRDIEVKTGQIAHLDGNSSNDAFDNLAFLCMDHHDRYDSKTSQSKNFTMPEVKRYREELYRGIIPGPEVHIQAPQDRGTVTPRHGIGEFERHATKEQKEIILELLSRSAPIRSVTYLANKLSLPVATVMRFLCELSRDGVVRIDRSKASTRKTYSLATSIENRLIDAFVATLDTEVVSDERYLIRRDCELDAVITTASATTYAVETMVAQIRISRDAVERRIRVLTNAKTALKIVNTTSVLLVGITPMTRRNVTDLKGIEEQGVVVKYVELEQSGPTTGSTIPSKARKRASLCR